MSDNSKLSKRRHALGWLELSLGAAGVVLAFQLIPQLWRETLWAIDLRTWSQGSYMLVTAAVLLSLLGMRFAPQLAEQYRQRNEQRAKQRAEEDRVRTLREQKETLERMKEGMKRRMY